MGTVPEGDSGFAKDIGDRHHGRTDDAESMFDPVHLQGFDEGFLGCHFHGAVLYLQRNW